MALYTGADQKLPMVIFQVAPCVTDALVDFRIDYLRRAFTQVDGIFDAVIMFWADDLQASPDSAVFKILTSAFPGKVTAVDKRAINATFPHFFKAQVPGADAAGHF